MTTSVGLCAGDALTLSGDSIASMPRRTPCSTVDDGNLESFGGALAWNVSTKEVRRGLFGLFLLGGGLGEVIGVEMPDLCDGEA